MNWLIHTNSVVSAALLGIATLAVPASNASAAIVPADLVAKVEASSASVNLSWRYVDNGESAASAPASIQLLRGIETRATWPWPTSVASYRDTGLSPGAKYIYKVCALYAGGVRCSNEVGVSLMVQSPVTPPPGTYTKSCRAITFNGTVLSATCQHRDNGSWVTTSIADARGCTDIYNTDGTLHCDKGNPPNGSYKQTCHSSVLSGTILTSVCRTKSGNWIPSQLDLGHCPRHPGYNIGNGDGHLGCQ